jgi:hypothetical protein
MLRLQIFPFTLKVYIKHTVITRFTHILPLLKKCSRVGGVRSGQRDQKHMWEGLDTWDRGCIFTG